MLKDNVMVPVEKLTFEVQKKGESTIIDTERQNFDKMFQELSKQIALIGRDNGVK